MEIFVFMALNEFQDLLKSIVPHSLLPSYITPTDYVPLNLSVENKELKSVNVGSVQDLQNYVWHIMAKNTGKVAYGGYLEKRGIYKRSDYFNQEDPNTERNIHLGIDLWIDAGTPIYAPLSGTLHSFNNNTNFGDYGPCIILKHQIKELEFFTLYGHLSLESLSNKEIGKQIEKGEPFATLGTAEVNGTYPPHLHFQIIKDIQDYKGDYPGVSNILNLQFYKDNCPDPNLLLKIN
ncbi:peptidoglycan DD-metalloendopeptidase family protein [Winogradskyella alexanderae]|uniref:Peptidoglycan DD-metalloendopeptidase family protein n=1 Tax=Winogradskyella alexanderae TaxID=2877123 RepID=A0ABS7XPR4_9FLAO|nr:peptidoglycan DD-metalloendopeptidase family protein [Winogradskyella alexanderae]MCA0132002.1 peptidoglycan DD-metalloendopeptidase family protein [Winogradskyella alexanderae]